MQRTLTPSRPSFSDAKSGHTISGALIRRAKRRRYSSTKRYPDLKVSTDHLHINTGCVSSESGESEFTDVSKRIVSKSFAMRKKSTPVTIETHRERLYLNTRYVSSSNL